MKHALGDVLIDGVAVAPEDAAVSIFDIGLQRGYGCFEALRSYGGRPFRMDAHLERLEVSADKLRIDLPDRATLGEWVQDRAGQAGDCVVRVLVTGGISLLNPGTESRILVIAEPVPRVPDTLRVLPLPAPWHSDRTDWSLTGAKTLSYAPNVAASLAARAQGYDDALLVGADEVVLEGPTYSIGWVRDGLVETPSLDVGILASITRAAVIEVAEQLDVRVTQRAFRLGRLIEADEAFVMSTVKQVLPIVAVGEQPLEAGPITSRLVAGFASLVAAETGG
jgi:branched-chain amino acid aminotransferase